MPEENTNDELSNTPQEVREEKKKDPAVENWNKLENQIRLDMDANPRYTAFFEGYETSSVKSFKFIYAYRKTKALLYGQHYKDEQDDNETMFTEMAEDKLWEIQQRKLFDLQIRWRAELIKIPEIEVTEDFKEWSEKIEICPFISPISQDEFNLYMSFIGNSSMKEIDSRWYKWQEYEDFKQQYVNIDGEEYEEEIPAWYEYYEMKTGLGSLYMLEDIRGKKEEFYCNLRREEWRRKDELRNKDKPVPEPDNRPYLSNEDGKIIEFMNRFEDAKTIGLMTARMKNEEVQDNREFNEAIETLRYTDEKVPVEFNEDWRQGVIEAANNYIKNKLLAELPKAYQRYVFRINNGLGFTPKEVDHSLDFNKLYKEMILRGRELNGEPRDFNF